MIKILQTLTLLLIALIFLFWVGDFFFMAPAMVADYADQTNNVDNPEWIKDQVLKERISTLYYFIPTIILSALTIISIREKKAKLFYLTFLGFMTGLQTIPAFYILKIGNYDPFSLELLGLSILLFCFLLLIAQVIAVYQLFKISKSTLPW